MKWIFPQQALQACAMSVQFGTISAVISAQYTWSVLIIRRSSLSARLNTFGTQNFFRLKRREELEELGINRTVVEHVVRKWCAGASTGVLCLRNRSSNRFFEHSKNEDYCLLWFHDMQFDRYVYLPTTAHGVTSQEKVSSIATTLKTKLLYGNEPLAHWRGWECLGDLLPVSQ